MKRELDPLLSGDNAGRDRLNYAQGILLSSEDFIEEQTYHRSRLSRSLRHLFGTGTAWGLRVELAPIDGDDWEVRVFPGLAIDNFGRLIEVPRMACMALAGWRSGQLIEDLQNAWMDDGGGFVLMADVFVRFVECYRGKRPAFRSGPFDATDAVTDSRVRDGYELALVPRPEPVAIRTGVPDAALPDPQWRARTRTFHQQNAEAVPATLDATIQARHEALLALETFDGPVALQEHLQPPDRPLPGDPPPQRDPTEVGRDPSSVLLARLALPIVEPTDPEERPVLVTAGPPPTPNNLIRRFVYAPSVLISLLEV